VGERVGDGAGLGLGAGVGDGVGEGVGEGEGLGAGEAGGAPAVTVGFARTMNASRSTRGWPGVPDTISLNVWRPIVLQLRANTI